MSDQMLPPQPNGMEVVVVLALIHCAPYCAILYCTALNRTALHCTGLRCTELHCTVLHCIVLRCTALHCTVLPCTELHCTALYCTALYCTARYCTALHRTALPPARMAGSPVPHGLADRGEVIATRRAPQQPIHEMAQLAGNRSLPSHRGGTPLPPPRPGNHTQSLH